MKSILSVIFLVVIQFVFAQDLKQDLVQMNKYLNDLSSFRLNVNYEVQDSIKEEGSVSVVKCVDGLFYQMDGISIVINEQHTLIIDDQKRTIIYSENSKKKNKGKIDVQKNLLTGLDSLIEQMDSVYFMQKDDKKMYYLRSKDAYFNLIEIEFSGKVIDKVTYYYNPTHVDGQVGLKTVNTLNFIEAPEFDRKLLQTSFYMELVDTTYHPTESFKNYLLILNANADEYFK